MLKTIKIILTLLISTCLISGCANMKHGCTQIITINSIPEGAKVLVEPGKEEGITPTKIVLKRKLSYVVHINMDGFKPENISLESSSSGEVWKNIVWIHPIGWIIGGTIDLTTGASKELSPENIDIKLTPIK
jgi:hypothetical protein